MKQIHFKFPEPKKGIIVCDFSVEAAGKVEAVGKLNDYLTELKKLFFRPPIPVGDSDDPKVIGQECIGRLRAITDTTAFIVTLHLFTEQWLNQILLKFCPHRDLTNYTYLRKLEICHALGKLTDDLFFNLSKLNKLRNRVAHNLNFDLTTMELDYRGCLAGFELQNYKPSFHYKAGQHHISNVLAGLITVTYMLLHKHCFTALGFNSHDAPQLAVASGSNKRMTAVTGRRCKYSTDMNTKDFLRLGVPLGQATRLATDFVARFILGGGDKSRLHVEVAAIVANPPAFLADDLRKDFAKALLNAPPPPRAEPVKYHQWGEGLDHEAVMQMERACLLPVSVAGALMPDAHVGYGLPIGGVLATENAVIPYAVGVDIACRMKMTVLDIPVRDLEQKQDRLTRAIEAETRFGVGANFKQRRAHDVLDADWSVSPVTKQNKDKAWSQLGTSGSGNHFVEFGIFTLHADLACPLNRPSATFSPAGGEGRDERASQRLPAGQYVTLLSHSGSRGTGAAVCDHYSKIAFNQFPDLPSELKRLAWLSLESQEGQEYWNAMELMGQYAAANHACIHRYIAENLGAQVLLDLENHHNFAWKEKHVIDGAEREVVVHRKGATPAGAGVLGIIPGSMATPGFVVSGKGNAESLNSASHGAGRAMSRKAANEKFNWKDVNRFLRERGVTLISSGLDEVPMAYKNIREVMEAQRDLVTVLGQFDPKLVKMAPAGERPED